MVLVLLVVLGVNGIVLFSLLQLRKSFKLQQAVVDRHTMELAELYQEVKALLNADIVFGRSIKQLSQQLRSLDLRQDKFETESERDSAYHHAVKLLQMGEEKNEVMKSCNLSNAEVDLLSNLNGYKALMNK